jgi:hypothetical protein
MPSPNLVGKGLAQEFKQEGFEMLDKLMADGLITFLAPPGMGPVRQIRAEQFK